MTNSKELLNKVITTTGFAAGGGLLKPEQSDRFIDYMWNASVLLPQVRTRRMTRDVEDIDKINVGRRILRGASEAVDDGMVVGVGFTKVSLTATKLRADWELSTDVLEDNLEGAALEEHIARLLTTQIGQDMEDLAINGNKSSSDPLLHHLDGWGIRGKTDGHVVDATDGTPGGVTDTGTGETGTKVGQILDKMIRTMPRDYMGRRQGLRFFASSDIVQRHVDEIGEAVANGQNFDPRAELGVESVLNGPVGYSVAGKGGIRLQEVPLMGEFAPGQTTDPERGEIWLTDPNNLVWGVRRDLQVYNRFNQKTDSIEYTVYTRVAAAVEEVNAFVVATGVSYERPAA